MKHIQGKDLYRFWKIETPSGTVDGTNTVFSVSLPPVENDAVLVFKNGLLQTPLIDYTMSGQVITFTTPPALAQAITVQYVQNSGE